MVSHSPQCTVECAYTPRISAASAPETLSLLLPSKPPSLVFPSASDRLKPLKYARNAVNTNENMKRNQLFCAHLSSFPAYSCQLRLRVYRGQGDTFPNQ